MHDWDVSKNDQSVPLVSAFLCAKRFLKDSKLPPDSGTKASSVPACAAIHPRGFRYGLLRRRGERLSTVELGDVGSPPPFAVGYFDDDMLLQSSCVPTLRLTAAFGRILRYGKQTLTEVAQQLRLSRQEFRQPACMAA